MSGGAIPPLVLSVGISTARESMRVGRKSQRYIKCKAWTLCAWETEVEGYEEYEVAQGYCHRRLWKCVAAALQEQEIIWLWTFGLRELLILTDWYAALECDEWITTSSRLTQHALKTLGIKRHWRGYLIDSDPPNLCMAMHAKTGHIIHMVDVQNFGVQTWADLRRPDEIADAATYERYATSGGHAGCSYARAMLVGSWAVGWSRLVQEQHWGPLRPTAAGQAIAAFRAKHMKHLVLCHDNTEAKQLERDAYYPGRCEAYRIGFVDGPIFHLDVRACYPSISRDERVPCRFKGISTPAQDEIQRLAEDGWLIIADVTLETNQANYPYRDGENVIYPMGRFRTQLCWPELEDAITNGRVVKVHKVARYEGDKLLEGWSNEMLDLRACTFEEGLPTLQVGIKCIANALYGAFAKRSRRWIACPHTTPPGPYYLWYGQECGKCYPVSNARDGRGELASGFEGTGNQITRWRSIGWAAEFEVAERESPESVTAVSAWVCSLGRRYMQRLLQTAGGGNVVYCDTDSLWVNERGIDNLSHAGCVKGGSFGYLGIKGSFNSVIIHGHKSYSAGLAGAHCGVPAGAMIQQDGSAEWDSFEMIMSACRRRDRPLAIVVNRRRGSPTAYTGGHVTPDGMVTPLWKWTSQ